MHILLIDDDPQCSWVLKDILEPKFIVSESHSGKDALQVVASAHPKITLAFIDIRMPLMNGLELVTKIREHGNGIPIVLYSSDPDLPKIASHFQTFYLKKEYFTQEKIFVLLAKIFPTL